VVTAEAGGGEELDLKRMERLFLSLAWPPADRLA
jgi:hypothetical protein